jgi:hypothetical protein
MNRLSLQLLTVLAISLLRVCPALAYTIALNDGRLVQFHQYRTTENGLIYVDDQGREISISWAAVDLDRTRELNAKERRYVLR